MEVDSADIHHLTVCSEAEFVDCLDKLDTRGLISLVSGLQREMTDEQEQFDELSERISRLTDSSSREHHLTSTALCRSQARLAQLCARNMKCFTQQSLRAKQMQMSVGSGDGDFRHWSPSATKSATVPRNGFRDHVLFFELRAKKPASSVSLTNGHSMSASSPDLAGDLATTDIRTSPNGGGWDESEGWAAKQNGFFQTLPRHTANASVCRVAPSRCRSTDDLDERVHWDARDGDGTLGRGRSVGDALDSGSGNKAVTRVLSVEEILQSVKDLRMRQQNGTDKTGMATQDYGTESVRTPLWKASHTYENVVEPIYQKVAGEEEPIYENVSDEPLYDVPRKWDGNRKVSVNESIVPVATQLVLKAQVTKTTSNDSGNDVDISDCDKDSLEDEDVRGGRVIPEIPSPDYGSDDDDAAYGVYDTYGDEYDGTNAMSDVRSTTYYLEDQGLEVIVEEDEDFGDDEDEDYVSRSEKTLSIERDSPAQSTRDGVTNGFQNSDSDESSSLHRADDEGDVGRSVRRNVNISNGSADKLLDLLDSAVDVDDLSSLDGAVTDLNNSRSLLASPVDTGDSSCQSWIQPPLNCKSSQDDGDPNANLSLNSKDGEMGDSYWSAKTVVSLDEPSKHALPSVRALRNQFESTASSSTPQGVSFPATLPRSSRAVKRMPQSSVTKQSNSLQMEGWNPVESVGAATVRRSRSVVSDSEETIPQLLQALSNPPPQHPQHSKKKGSVGGMTTSSSVPSFRRHDQGSYSRNGGWNGTMIRTAKPIFSPDPPPSPDDEIPSIIAQFGGLDDFPATASNLQSVLHHWDPTLLLKELYHMQSPQPLHDADKTPIFVNIEGYLDKLPSGRRKATFWNAWKRRYFRLKDGYLYYYQNHTSEKPSLTLNLMGGHIDSMETTMLGMDDGPEKDLDLVIDDGKGHYVVVRCSSRSEAEQWRAALSTHTAENFSLTYAQPVPAYPHFYEDVLIIDLGSCSLRAGILCNQATLPQLFFPTVSSLHRESGERGYGMEALAPFNRTSGSVAFPLRHSREFTKFSVDLDAVVGLLTKVFTDLNVEPRKYQIQLSLPRSFTVRTQSEVLRLLFDHFSVRSVNLTTQTVLALLSYNATSGIVVDIGERMDIIPIIDGYVVEPGVSRIPYGGNRVLEHLQHFLIQRHYTLASDVETYLVRYVMENICYCAEKYNDELQRFFADPDSFERCVSIQNFFNGDAPWQEICLDNGCFQAAEGLFNPDAWGLDHPGVHKLVHRAIQECSLDIRKEMTRSIYLSGGLTLLPGFGDRLELEVNKLTPPSLTPKVHASPYRYHAAYLGACILASSPGFEEAKITADDWRQNGAQCLRKWHL